MNLLFLDGGGTKLQAICYIDNKIVSYATYGSCNLTLDFVNAKTNIYAAIEYFRNQFLIDAILISAAGALSCPELAKEIARTVLVQYRTPVQVISDIEYHYFKYFLKQDGCVVNLGTGTSALVFKNGHRQLYFGYGPNFEEPGCGHDIGKKLLAFLADKEVNDNYNALYCKFLSDYQLNSIRQDVKHLNHLNNSEIANQAKWLLSLTELKPLYTDVAYVIHTSFDKLIAWLQSKQFTQVHFIGGIVKNHYIQNELQKIIPQAYFNAKNNFTMEEIWNMLLA